VTPSAASAQHSCSAAADTRLSCFGITVRAAMRTPVPAMAAPTCAREAQLSRAPLHCCRAARGRGGTVAGHRAWGEPRGYVVELRQGVADGRAAARPLLSSVVSHCCVASRTESPCSDRGCSATKGAPYTSRHQTSHQCDGRPDRPSAAYRAWHRRRRVSASPPPMPHWRFDGDSRKATPERWRRLVVSEGSRAMAGPLTCRNSSPSWPASCPPR
jgi:hypothetical protein